MIPLVAGAAATIVAALLVLGWIGLGTLFFWRLADDDEAALPIRLLAGSATTSFVMALAAAAGRIPEGLAACALLCAIPLAVNGRRVLRSVTHCLGAYRAAVQSRLAGILLSVAGIVAWIAAIAPPRSADAMRYHLAHIRLIIQEGRWNPIQDFHFALPFGWSLSFIPFEMLGLAQGAQVLSLILLVLLGGALTAALAKAGAKEWQLLVPLLLLLHPFVLRTFTEASADPYSLYVVLAITLLLMKLPRLAANEAVALGFVSWIGIQSCYQLVAIGIAAMLVALVVLVRSRARTSTYAGIGLGCVAAGLLASPFYIANAMWFGNPVWPLLISRARADSSFADLVAWYYGRSLTGVRTPAYVAESIWELLTWPRLFPMALMIVAALVAAVFARRDRLKPLALFGLLFLAIWTLMQPLLYPRFVLTVLPVAILCGTMLVALRESSRNTGMQSFMLVLLTAAVTVNTVLSRESIAYAAGGKATEFHRHTWFYPVYRWANEGLPADARVLVIVRSGMTYYLERPYRRADPWIGGAVDWPRIADAAALVEVLRSERYTHVIYEDRDWTSFRGGAAMQKVMAEGIRKGILAPLQTFDLRLYTSRATRRYLIARVTVLAVSPAIVGRARSAAIASATSR